jgi:hypothetical protein
MYRKLLLIPALVLFSLILMRGEEARACEPCTKDASMQFEETARNADLIVVGRRDDFSPDELTHGLGGPENIKLKVVRVLKGKEERAEIAVRSWSGMCPYGIILNDNSEHVVFLKKSGDNYRAVDMCSVKDYAVKDGVVEFGKEQITIEDFKSKLEQVGLSDKAATSSGVFSTFYRMMGGGETRGC